MLVLIVSVCRAEKDPAPFKFGKVEREVLEETKTVEELFREQGLLCDDQDLTGWLVRIGTVLVGQQPPLENVTFRFAALRDPIPNVIALPNGSIYITTGMLATLENQDQLAGVMAHGIAEVANRQPYFFLRAFRKKAITRALLLAPIPGSSLFGGSIMARLAGGPALQAAMVSGYGEQLEKEAGRDALKRLHAAGYDPRALPRALNLLAAGANDERSRFRYQSRTGLAARERALRECIAEMQVDSASNLSEGDYLTHAEPAIMENIHAEIVARNPGAALSQARRLVLWNRQEPRYQLLLADSLLAAKDRGQAEPVYRRIIDREPALAGAHYGLGHLLEQEGRKEDAAAEYQHYLVLAAPTALARRRVEHRLAALAAPTQHRAASMQRACVLPADIHLKRSWIEDSVGLTKRVTAWKEQLGKLILASLVKAGVGIVPFRSTPAELLEARAAYNVLAADIEKHSKNVEKGQFTIDDAVAVLPCASTADTIVFIRGRSEVTGTRMNLGWEGADAVHVSFIDARNGVVFNHFRVHAEGTITDTASVLGQDIERRIEKVKKRR